MQIGTKSKLKSDMQGGHKLANKTTLEIIGEVVDTNVLNDGIVTMETITTD